MATKLECFILHRSEVVLTLALLYSRALSTEKHIFHKFLTRQIAHRSHHSALVILILFTPIKKKGLQNTGLAEMNFLGSVPCLRLPRKEALRQKSRVWLFGKRWAVWWLSLPSISPAQGAARQQRYPLAPPSPEWGKPTCLALPQLKQSPRCWNDAVLHAPSRPGESLPGVAVRSAAAVWILQWRGCLERALVLLWNFSLLPDCYKEYVDNSTFTHS